MMGNIVDVSELLLELGLSDSVTDEERAIADVAITKAEGAVIRHLQYDPVKRERTEYYPRMDFLSRGGAGIWETGEGIAFFRRQAEAVTDELQVQHLPIRSITSLFVDFDGRFGARAGAFSSGTELNEGDDFWPVYDGNDDEGDRFCRDGIIRSQGTWPSIAGSVKIIYEAGYSLEELHGQKTILNASPIAEAILSEAARKAQQIFVRKKQGRVGFVPGVLTSEKLGDYSYTIDASLAKSLFGSMWTLTPETIQALNDFVNMGVGIAS